MRFESMKVKGFGPFREEVNVDLTAVTGPLVAIVGENGAGKSTILELFAAAMYRHCPTRGALSTLAIARDASLEVGLVNGSSHRIRHVVDNVSGKGESVVTDAEGRPRVASGKMREYDAWAAKHLPAKEVFFASVFSPQKSQGFLDMSASERKGTLLRCLGIERYEALAENAREHMRALKGEVTTLDARLADEKSRASSPATVSAELAKLRADREAQAIALDQARAAYEAIVATDADYQAAARAADELQRKIDGVETRLRDARGKKLDLEKRIRNNEGVLTQRAEIDEAKASAEKLDAEIEQINADDRVKRAAEGQARANRSAAREAAGTATAAVEQARVRADRLRGRASDKVAVDAAVASLEELRGKADVASGEVSAWELKIRESQELILNGATNRIEGLRRGLADIVGSRDGGVCDGIAEQTLSDDDVAAAKAKDAPSELVALRAELAERKTALAEAQRALSQTEKTAARASEIAAAEADLAKSETELAGLENEEKSAKTRFEDASKAADEAMAALDAVAAEYNAKKVDRAKLDPLLKRAEPLAQADARLAELRPQFEAVNAELSKLESERADLGDPQTPTAAPNLALARAAMNDAERDLRGTEGGIAVKESHLVEAEAAAVRIAVIEEERTAALATLADWTLLAESLGRDGLQAMEIDAAGPRLTEIANELLHDAFGPRFTIRFDLSRRSSDGKKDIEGLDVTVLDTERGREANAETLSGGEGVIISEAIALALTTIACARSGVERPTLVRDESGAALDERRAPQYVRMLRRAAELIGADKVLLVSHSPAVWDLCDSRIEIADGKVKVAA